MATREEPAIDATLTALADPTRRRVVRFLTERECSAGELAEAVGVTPPALSRHLRVLRRSGLIDEAISEADRRQRILRLNPAALTPVKGWIAEMEALWTDQLAAFKRHAERTRGRR